MPSITVLAKPQVMPARMASEEPLLKNPPLSAMASAQTPATPP